MKVPQELWIEYVVPGYPRALLWTSSFPVYQVLQQSTSMPGVQELPDSVDRGFLVQRGGGFFTTSGGTEVTDTCDPEG